MAEEGKRGVWVVVGHSESGDEDQWTYGHRPTKAELLELVQGLGDDAGMAGLLTPDDLDDDGYVLDAAAFGADEDPDLEGPGFAGSYWMLETKETELR